MSYRFLHRFFWLQLTFIAVPWTFSYAAEEAPVHTVEELKRRIHTPSSPLSGCNSDNSVTPAEDEGASTLGTGKLTCHSTGVKVDRYEDCPRQPLN